VGPPGVASNEEKEMQTTITHPTIVTTVTTTPDG
jgi:hypothetical protein